MTRAGTANLTHPCCGAPARLRISVHGLKHFYHPPGSSCATAGETMEPLLAKAVILEACVATGHTAVTEWAENCWRADVLAWRDTPKGSGE